MRLTRHTVLTATLLLIGCATDDHNLGGNTPLNEGGSAGSGGAAGSGGSGGGTQGNGGASGTSPGATSDVYTAFADQVILPGVVGGARCLPRPLDLQADGTAACAIVQVRPASDCGCSAPGFRPASAGLVAAARVRMQAVQLCGLDGRPACESVCFCELEQLSGSAAEQCLAGTQGASPGWCYIDPSQSAGSEAAVEGCPELHRRRIMFTEQMATPGAFTILACMVHGTWPSLSPAGNGAIGDACIPSSEGDASFSGFWNTEVSVELGSRQCVSGLCLANHFKGRVTCPYGQAESGVADSRSPCALPPSGGSVVVAVEPQDSRRRSADAVYCSCRCAGPGPGPFCACQPGFTCTPLIDDFVLQASSAVAGSYCIKQGTEYRGFEGPACDRQVLNCE